MFVTSQVEDQMKLLQNCWSELLILDLIFRQVTHNNFEELIMVRLSVRSFVRSSVCLSVRAFVCLTRLIRTHPTVLLYHLIRYHKQL